MHFKTNLFFSIWGVGGHFNITDHLKLLTSLVRPSGNYSPTRIIQNPFHDIVMKWKTETYQAWICVHDVSLFLYGEITQSSALMCGVLSVGWQAQASCDRMLGSQQQGIKCRRFYYNMRSTIQLTLRPQALLHLRLAMAPRLTSGSTGQLWRARNHSLKSVDADGLMDLKSTALISKSNVSWFEISLLDNWYNKFWKHCTFHQCSFLN